MVFKPMRIDLNVLLKVNGQDSWKKMSYQKLLLAKLNKYGDSVLGEDSRSSKLSSKNRKSREATHNKDNHGVIKGGRGHKDSFTSKEKISNSAIDSSTQNLSKKEKQILSFKSDLGLLEMESKTLESDEVRRSSKIRTSVTSPTDNKRAAPEVVVFIDKSKRKKEKKLQNLPTEEQLQDENQSKFIMRKARFEVQKFGIAGFKKEKKEEAMTALLVRLGAKPPKNKYINYREFQEMKKKEKEEAAKDVLDGKFGSKSRKRKLDSRKTDKEDKIKGFLDGQIGKYKNGVQVVSRSDIQLTKAKRRK